MKTSFAAMGLIVALGASQSADAGLIDFTDGGWTANNPRSFGSLSVTLEAFNASGSTGFTETAFDGDITQCGPLGLTCASDGIGILNDEVSFGVGEKTEVQRLKITFSRAVDIASIFFLDLFGSGANNSDPVAEIAQFQVNGTGAGGGFTGTALDGTGLFDGTIANASPLSSLDAFTEVSSIEFFADTANLSSLDNTDFALAGIRTLAVREPGTLALFGLGLLGLGIARSRKAS